MKRIFIMLIVAMLSFSVDAQNLSTKEVSEAYAEAMKSDVTMFLGIPVDGTVSSMKQKLETLSDFLLNSKENRKWVNNENYFGEIEETYTRAGKNIRVVDYNECKKCPVFKNCCGVRAKNSETPILIENSGRQFRICKPDVLVQRKEEHQRLLEAAERRLERERYDELEAFRDPSERTCFDCKSNLTWMNKKGVANCGPYQSMGVPKNTPPHLARTCRGFKRKIQ